VPAGMTSWHKKENGPTRAQCLESQWPSHNFTKFTHSKSQHAFPAHAYFRRPPSGLALPLRPPIPGIPGIPPAPPPIPAIICCRPSMPVCVCKDYVSASQHNHASFPSRSTISAHRHDACTDISTPALASHTLTAHRLDLLQEHVGIHLPKSNPFIMSVRPDASVLHLSPKLNLANRQGGAWASARGGVAACLACARLRNCIPPQTLNPEP